LAAFEEYRDSYTSGAFADTALTTETIAGIPDFFSEPSNTNGSPHEDNAMYIAP